jgi:DNA-binding response OmpR family regulator
MSVQPIKVAIVEDSADIRDMYRRKLEEEGFEVQTAGDGSTGIDLVQKWQPQVVLLDIMMPEFTGIDFLSSVRRAVANDPLKIIVLTNVEDDHLKKSLDKLIDDYIVKANVTPKEIVERIRTLLK